MPRLTLPGFKLLAFALLLSLTALPALAADPAAAPTAVTCANLDDCMSKGQQSETIEAALAYFSKGISLWKPGDSSDDLALATVIRAQTYIS